MNSDIGFAMEGPTAFSGLGLLGLLLAVPWLVPLLLWCLIGGIMLFRGNFMDRPNRVPQFYGYTVCIIALIVGLASLSSLIDSAFERAYPLQDEYAYGQSLSSFEAYMAKRATMPRFTGDGAPPPDTASPATLRARYDALVADRIAATRFGTSKAFVRSGLFLLIAFGLFRYHWRWMSRLQAEAAAG